jgi:uncharacterized protein YgiM (DUF1202 family)
MTHTRRLLRHTALALACSALLLPVASRAADEPLERVQVADPYLELHTGPGRGYPIFHVAARAEWVEIQLRHTDWFKVRTDNGKEGWVHRSQLESTLTASGDPKTFRELMQASVLQRRGEIGGAFGRFKSEPMFKLWAGWRLGDVLSAEGTIGTVQGEFSGTSFWHLGLNAEPWADQRFSPFFGIGLGKFHNIPNRSLVAALDTNAKLAHATVGLRWRIGERFLARVDYAVYTAFVADTRSTEYRAVSAGIGFHF